MKNAVTFFVRQLERLLRPCARCTDTELITAYLDDICIASTEEDKHVELLHSFLLCCRNSNIKLAPDKMQIGRSHVNYIGHTINGQYYFPMRERTKSIIDMKPPTNINELRRFLGKIEFVAKILPKLHTVAHPLYEILRGGKFVTSKSGTRKRVPIFYWTDECQRAFDRVKTLLASDVILWHADPNKPFDLFVDGSDVASGSVLMQQKDGMLRVVAYHSKMYSREETRYSASERKALAILHALRKHRLMLKGGALVRVHTDHRALIPILLKQQSKNDRINRWLLEMSDYSLEVQYIKGSKQAAADCLSRPVGAEEADKSPDTEDDIELDGHIPICTILHSTDEQEDKDSFILSNKTLIAEQKRDRECKLIRRLLSLDESKRPKEASRELTTFAVRCKDIDGVLTSLDMDNKGTRVPVLPQSMHEHILFKAHAEKNVGHVMQPMLGHLLRESCLTEHESRHRFISQTMHRLHPQLSITVVRARIRTSHRQPKIRENCH